jgi:hypothetical protein
MPPFLLRQDCGARGQGGSRVCGLVF